MKILILIIASENQLYNKMKFIQQAYIHNHKDIETYFVVMKPDLETEIELVDKTIYLKGEETYLNILRKTVVALKYLLNENEYDYVIRSNLSTIIDLDLLEQYCSSLPEINVYTGGRLLDLEWEDPNMGVTSEYKGLLFVQGSFIVFSSDVINNLISNEDKLLFEVIDDVSIALFISRYTNISKEKIIEFKPKFCLDNLTDVKLKQYSTEKHMWVAYRNKRKNRESDIDEMINQVNEINKNYIKKYNNSNISI